MSLEPELDEVSTVASTIKPGTNISSEACNLKPDGSVQPDPFGFGLSNSFAGIPQTLCINIIIAALLVAVFIILRKRGWGSAKIPLVGRRTNEWSSIFYGNRSAVDYSDSEARVRGLDSPGSAILRSAPESPDGYDVGIVPLNMSPDSPDALSFRQWVKNAFMAKDEFLLERSGPAALEYLRFQRHVIAFTAVLCIISIAIILPVNYRGTKQQTSQTTFPKTTINNVNVEHVILGGVAGIDLTVFFFSSGTKGDLLWVHVAFTMILFPMGLLAMLSYGMKFELSKGRKKVVKTLMFYGLDPRITTEEKIREHFEEAYPDVQVTAIFLTLDVAKLQTLDDELKTVTAALQFYEKTMSERSERPVVKDVACGFCCGCCVNGVDAVDYYQNKKADLEKKILEQVQVWKKTNPVFFVSFANEEEAYKVYTAYRAFWGKKPVTSVSPQIGAKRWTCRLAPSAPFVSWENLSVNGWWWWIRAMLLNAVIVVFFIFVSTPAVAINLLALNSFDWFKTFQSLPFISQYLPALLLLSIWGLVPLLMYYVVQWTGYHTRSKEMRAEMKLVYAFLIIAILIFPSLALTSGNVVIKALYEGGINALKWDCAFLPDNGAIFANLMATTAFLGAAFNLLRVGQLIVFLIGYCSSKSEAERHIVTRTKNIFYFHSMYPDFILSFTIVAVYCFICPVVTPIGLLAMCTRYLVDRYNLSYVYGRSEAPTSVHASAVNFFLVGILMQNFLMIFFFVIRGGIDSKSSLLIAVLVINGMIYIGISWFGLLKKVSLDDEYTEDDIDTPGQSPAGTPVKKSRSTYVPPVLQRFESRKSSPSSGSVAITNSTVSA